MDLIVNHVLQTLVVGGAKENLRVQLAASEAIVEDLVATEMVVVVLQEVRNLLHVNSIVEGRGISYLTLVGRDLQGKGHMTVLTGGSTHTHLALKALDQVTNCHTRWNSVRIDDDIRGNPLACKRHVLDFFLRENITPCNHHHDNTLTTPLVCK